MVKPYACLWQSASLVFAFTPSQPAVKFGYPGHFATRADARAALRLCCPVKQSLHPDVKIPVEFVLPE